MSSEIPKRPADATTPNNPQVKVGNYNLKILIHMPKINASKATIYVKGYTFHCNTIGQRPCYYLTHDLSSLLGPHELQLDDEKASASYEKGYLCVIVPLIGSPEQIAEARKWRDPSKVKSEIAAKKERKREREEQLAVQEREEAEKRKLKKQQDANGEKAKRKKKKQKKNNAAGGGGGGGVVMENNRVIDHEEHKQDEIADAVLDKVEAKVNAAVEKTKAKEEWMESYKAQQQEKAAKKTKNSKTLREQAMALVEAKMSGADKKLRKKAKKEEKEKEKSKSEKPKKSVRFEGGK